MASEKHSKASGPFPDSAGESGRVTASGRPGPDLQTLPVAEPVNGVGVRSQDRLSYAW